MDIFVEVDIFFFGKNPVWNVKVEITNFRILLKTQIHYKLAFPALQENSQQQKSDKIKILHLYLVPPFEGVIRIWTN